MGSGEDVGVAVTVGGVTVGRDVAFGTGGMGVAVAITAGVGDCDNGISGVTVAVGLGVLTAMTGRLVASGVGTEVVRAASSGVLVSAGVLRGADADGAAVGIDRVVGVTCGKGVSVESTSGSSPDVSHAAATNNKRAIRTPKNSGCRDTIYELCRVR